MIDIGQDLREQMRLQAEAEMREYFSRPSAREMIENLEFPAEPPMNAVFFCSAPTSKRDAIDARDE